MIHKVLIEALVELDDWLIKKDLYLELDIIGGIALHLHNIEISRASMDIDLANEIDSNVMNQIREIGRLYGLGDSWIESPDVKMPKGATFRSHPMFSGFQNIKARYLSLDDLILTKIAAFYDRKHIQDTDAQDIEAIIQCGGVFNEEVLDRGIIFIRQTRQIDEKKISQVREKLSTLY